MEQRDFKEIYREILQSCGDEIEKKRKNFIKKTIVSVLIVLVIWFAVIFSEFNNMLFLIIIALIFTVVFFKVFLSKAYKDYKKIFKERIINEIVQKSNSDFKYYCSNGIDSNDYRESCFEANWDRYKSEDLIKGKLEDGIYVRMAQVHTEQKYESVNSKGQVRTYYVTNFLGLYGIIDLKIKTNSNFMIMDNSKFSKFDKKRIEMESAEFEKYYDVFSGSKENGLRQNVMEILTPETIEEFVKIRNLFKKAINIRVFNDKIYFRIDVGDIFEPPTFEGISTNFDLLYNYFLIIDVPRMIYEALIDNILIMYGDKKEKIDRTSSKNK